MELIAEIWRFSLTPYGVWLWCLPVMVLIAAWSDWREYKERQRHTAWRAERIKRGWKGKWE